VVAHPRRHRAGNRRWRLAVHCRLVRRHLGKGTSQEPRRRTCFFALLAQLVLGYLV
jgi:hypothetical protein